MSRRHSGASLAALSNGFTVHLRMPGQQFLWRFTKTTSAHWKRTDNNTPPNTWVDHEQLAQLIELGTETNSLGETL